MTRIHRFAAVLLVLFVAVFALSALVAEEKEPRQVAYATLQGEAWTLFDKRGALFADVTYADVVFLTIGGNSILLVKQNGKYGLLDVNGKAVVDALYDEAYYDAKFIYLCKLADGKHTTDIFDGTANAVVKDVSGLVNSHIVQKSGSVIYPCIQGEVGSVVKADGAVHTSFLGQVRSAGWDDNLIIECDKEYFICDLNAKRLIDDGYKFASVLRVTDKRTTATAEDQWALPNFYYAETEFMKYILNAECEIVMSADDIQYLGRGSAFIVSDEKRTLTNIAKEMVEIEVAGKVSPFFHGLARVEHEGKFWFINSEGKKLLDKDFVSATDFEQGLAIVAEKQGAFVAMKPDGTRAYDEDFKMMERTNDPRVMKFADDETSGFMFLDEQKLYIIEKGKIDDLLDYNHGVGVFRTGDSLNIIRQAADTVSINNPAKSAKIFKGVIKLSDGAKRAVLTHDCRPLSGFIYDKVRAW